MTKSLWEEEWVGEDKESLWGGVAGLRDAFEVKIFIKLQNDTISIIGEIKKNSNYNV